MKKFTLKIHILACDVRPQHDVDIAVDVSCRNSSARHICSKRDDAKVDDVSGGADVTRVFDRCVCCHNKQYQSSVTRWLDHLLQIWLFTTNKWPNRKFLMPKQVQNFVKYLKFCPRLLKSFPNGEILPNLVTLNIT